MDKYILVYILASLLWIILLNLVYWSFGGDYERGYVLGCLCVSCICILLMYLNDYIIDRENETEEENKCER